MHPNQALEAVFGSLRWTPEPPVDGAPENRPHFAETRYRNAPLRVERTYQRSQTGTNRTVRRWVCALRTDLGLSELQLTLDPAYLFWPRVETGDPAFEASFRLRGVPESIVRPAFDAPLRARLLEAAPFGLHLEIGNGQLSVGVAHVTEEGPPNVQLLKAYADLLVEVANRLRSEIERQRQGATAQPGGEAAWRAALGSETQGAKAARDRRRRLILLAVALFVVLTVCGGCCSAIGGDLLPLLTGR